jgi:hypothetical protein
MTRILTGLERQPAPQGLAGAGPAAGRSGGRADSAQSGNRVRLRLGVLAITRIPEVRVYQRLYRVIP